MIEYCTGSGLFQKMLMADEILPQEAATYFLEVERRLFQPLWDAICKQDWMCAYNCFVCNI